MHTVQVLVYSNIKKARKGRLTAINKTQFMVMGKFRNYGRLRHNGVVSIQIV